MRYRTQSGRIGVFRTIQTRKGNPMPIEARRAYLKAIRERYKNSTRREKRLILNEFCATCRYSRKHAIRILNGKVEPRQKRRPGPKRKYKEIEGILFELWQALGGLCSKKLKEAFPLWLPYYKGASEEQKKLLYKISPATMDRYLEYFREKSKVKGLSTTDGSLKHQIPIKLLDSEIKAPGFIESDTVAHCGDNIAGEYAYSLTMTDLYSAWTENRASWTKKAEGIVQGVKNIEDSLPFVLVGFACDNGSEFLNDKLNSYLTERAPAVEFVRRRPYRKNDSAHVEQKNFTHVRGIFKYGRYDDPSLVEMMNEIYRVYWNPLWNYFTPVMKLKSKQRVGSKIIKKWDKPKTPCQRLLESESVPLQTKRLLKKTLKSKNPFFLKKELDKKLKLFFEKVEEIKRNRTTVPANPLGNI